MKFKTKLISALLSAVITASAVIIGVSAAGAGYKDVSAKDWYYASVQYVSDTGIMDGVGDGRFAPKATLTRAMGVTLLYRIAGEPDCDDLSNPFSDVGKSKYFTDPVKWAYARGIVTGKTATKFEPNDNITRAEFATILYRYAEYTEAYLAQFRTGDVKDSAKIPAYAKTAVTAMYRAEIINGRSDGRFDPSANINRAEAAAMMERYIIASSDSSDVTDGGSSTAEGMLVKEKLYEYGSANVAILSVENKNSEALTVTVKGFYKDSSGNIIKTESKTFAGFAAGWQNYFIFNPGISFDGFDFELTTKKFSGEVLSGHVSPVGALVELDVRNEDGSYGKPIANATPEEIAACKSFHLDLRIYQTHPEALDIYVDYVVFDNSGNIRILDNRPLKNIGGNDSPYGLGASAANPCCKDIHILKDLVSNMENCTSIMAVTEVSISAGIVIP